MKVKFYGTRGSVPIANPLSVQFGGNTTCVRIFSDCIPADVACVLDAGSGFVPFSSDVLRAGGVSELFVLFTHYHHDHTQGLFLSPLTFMKNIRLHLMGPQELGIGPNEMMADLMRPPYFPVHYKEVGSHIACKGFEFPKTLVLLFHSQGGYKQMNLDEFERLIAEGKHLPIGKGKYPVGECLVVKMYKSNHPEQTISYRFEERPTGKVFVLLTDHENGDALPLGLRNHLKGADLIVMDAQYPRKTYDERTAGFGHGTPDYCAKTAFAAGAKKLGLTHHDPSSTDANIKAILDEAIAKADGGKIDVFACADYQEVEV